MNLKLYNVIVFTKEIFWNFYFYPLVFSLIGIIILGALHQLNSLTAFIDGISCFSVYNLLFFFWFGKREKHFHGETE